MKKRQNKRSLEKTLSFSDIEEEIKNLLEENYQSLKLNGGHSLTEETRSSAFLQVVLYYRKMQHIAENVKRTEVKLTLPDQKTKAGKKFSIEGVVDIIQEDEIIAMYDIKTHDKDYIEMNKHLYKDQLNLYGFIYENLNNEKLDKTAIISTTIPIELYNGDDPEWDEKFDKWNPEINLDYNRKSIKKTVENFSDVVHKIENREFKPASLETLTEKPKGKNIPTFAIRICRNCDARYTCDSYLKYAENKRERSMATGFFQIYLRDEDKDRYLDLVKFDEPTDIDEPDLDDLG